MYYNSVENIQIVLISGKNIRHFMCALLLLLGETPLGINVAKIFASDRTVTSKGRLRIAQCEKGANVARERALLYCFVIHLCTQSSSDNCVALEMEHDGTFPSPRYGRASAHAISGVRFICEAR